MPTFDNVEVRDRTERLPFVGERHFDGVVHAAASEGFNLAALERAREQLGRETLADLFAVLVDKVVTMPAVAPVHATVRAEETAVNIGRVARETELGNENFPLVGDAVAVGVAQPPDIRRARRIDSALV